MAELNKNDNNAGKTATINQDSAGTGLTGWDPGEVLKQLTLEEKASLCSGKSFWHLQGIERLGVPEIMVTDGPHGLRKQTGAEDNLGINKSVPATCFPTASATACSWNRGLMREIGKALAEECLREGVSVLLGPGMNIKRSPLCGRNFEYISEDPLLTGEIAAALVNGVQSMGVGTSVKHFAVNNQERRRMVVDSIIDERALHEIYLSGFETVVTKAQPWTVMTAYNKVGGTYCSENRELLNDILRDGWGFEGLTVTDWGACNEIVDGLKAGLDLEMPSSHGLAVQKIVSAVNSGELEEAILDDAALRILKLIRKAAGSVRSGFKYNAAEHNELARKAEAESIVLLKNEGAILPLNRSVKLAVIGEFAKNPRYQGAGSSLINPAKLATVFDELTAGSYNFTYSRGYDAKSDVPDQSLIAEAAAAAKEADVALIFAGLTDRYESEGFDRDSMKMPASHNELISRVSAANPNTVVILSGGSPMEMPWIGGAKGLLQSHLGGQAGAAAVIDVLFGAVNPSGKLAETYPLKLSDTPCFRYFGKGSDTAEYRESIYVGYRYYDTAGCDVLFPFGFGLSYTHFEYSAVAISGETADESSTVKVTVQIKNAGDKAGSEVVQLYVKPPKSAVFKPEKELRGFEKVYLEPGESKTVSFLLDQRAFSYYNTLISDWHTEEGFYEILIGASSRDIRLKSSVFVKSPAGDVPIPDLRGKCSSYFNIGKEIGKNGLEIPDSDFENLYGSKLPPAEHSPKSKVTQNTALEDISSRLMGRIILAAGKANIKKQLGSDDETDVSYRVMWYSLTQSPLRIMVRAGDGTVTDSMLNGLIEMMNGHLIKGIRLLGTGSGKKKQA